MRIRSRHVFFLIGSAIALSLTLYLALTEWVHTEDLIFSSKAQQNKYLAAEDFLTRFGVSVDYKYDVENLNEVLLGTDVLIMTSHIGKFDGDSQSRLFKWIQDGGVLIYQPSIFNEGGSTQSDVILRWFKIGAVVVSSPDHKEILDTNERLEECPTEFDTTKIAFNHSEAPLEILTSRVWMLSYLQDGKRTANPMFVRDSISRGRVVISTSLVQWHNGLIGCYDNAHALRKAVLGDITQSSGTTKMTWVRSIKVPSITDLLWQWFPETIITLLVLLVFWLWNRLVREQIIDLGVPRRINSLEDYLTQKASFRWRNNISSEQLQNLRAEVTQNSWQSWSVAEYESHSNAAAFL